ncbi:hypothetical protein [Sphingomonas koreensis]
MIQTAKMTRLQLPLYIASLWLALATALLSSLMPAGLPRSTALGSAFNPATTAVALQPSRAQPRVVIENVRRDDEPASGQGDGTAIASLPAVPDLPVRTLPIVPEPPAIAASLSSPPVLDGSPRGPPRS